MSPARLAVALLALAPLGCFAPVGTEPPAPDDIYSDGGTQTFYRDVMPLTQQHCAGCHVAGGVAPFAMGSYEDVKSWHLGMAAAVQARTMPPWLPSERCQTFQDARTMAKWERDTISTWSAQGAAAGDPADAPTTQVQREELAWVDSSLQMEATYTPNAAVEDDYHCFVLDPKLTQDKDLVGYEIVPGERRTVHHVILYGASAADAAAKNVNGAGWTCYGGPGTKSPVMLGGWVPGTFVTQFPDTTGIPMKAGSVIVMQVHYNLAPGALPDRTTVKVQYAKARVSKPATIVAQAQFVFAMPPNAMDYSVGVRNEIIPTAKILWGVLPHMHTKGTKINVQMKTSASALDSSATCLIDIPRWDFHWQQLYFYEKPITLPTGGEVKLTCSWRNPTNKTVTWGEGTDDEMCLNYYYVTQ
jgi:hypothetical protein